MDELEKYLDKLIEASMNYQSRIEEEGIYADDNMEEIKNIKKRIGEIYASKKQ